MFVDRQHKRVFTSNVSRFPRGGMPDRHSRPEFANGVRPDKPLFFHENYATAPFFVLDPSKFTGIFASLRFVHRQDIRLESRPQGFITRHAELWTFLENFCLQCIRALSMSQSMTHLFGNLDTRPRRLPMENQYRVPSPDENEARQREFGARRDFVCMLGTLSAVLYSHGLSDEPNAWYQHLLDDHSLNFVESSSLFTKARVLEDIRLSVVNDFSLEAGRVGVFYDCSALTAGAYKTFLRNAEFTLRCNVPVWFYWGDPTQRFPPDAESMGILAPFLPNKQDFDAGHFFVCNSNPPLPQSACPTETPDASASVAWREWTAEDERNAAVVPPESWRRKSSRGRPSWETLPRRVRSLSAFFRWLLQEMHEYERHHEPQSHREVRLGREDRAASWKLSSGDSLVRWNLANDAIGPHVERISKNDATLAFEDAAPWSRRYDPFTQTWHICFGFYEPAGAYSERDSAIFRQEMSGGHGTDDEVEGLDEDDVRDEVKDLDEAYKQKYEPLLTSADISALEKYEGDLDGDYGREDLPRSSVEPRTCASPSSSRQETPARERTPLPASFIDTSSSSRGSPRRRDVRGDARRPVSPRPVARVDSTHASNPEAFFWTTLGLDCVVYRYFWVRSACADTPPDGLGGLTSFRMAAASAGLAVDHEVEDMQDHAEILDLTLDEARGLWHFIARLASKPRDELPKKTFLLSKELAPEFAVSLAASRLTAQRIQRPTESSQSQGGAAPEAVVRDEWCWVIEQRDGDKGGRPWVIVLYSALAVIWALRSEADDLFGLALRMAGEGIPFAMPVPRASVQAKSTMAIEMRANRALRGMLGWRPRGHDFVPNDFVTYERLRDKYLSQHPRVARSALLAGGIAWRLAIAAVSDRVVLDGPSDYASATEAALRSLHAKGGSEALGVVFNDGSQELVEDRLVSLEIEIVVGRYHQCVHESEGMPSYWPTPEQWRSSGWYALGWNDMAERWYQNRRNAYSAGDKKPQMSRTWLRDLRRCFEAKAVFRNVRMAANEFMDTHGQRFAPTT
jgi:hypothetical protein